METLRDKIRREIWDKMEKLNIANFPRPCHGRIPNFKGAWKAAMLLKMLDEYAHSRVVFCNPDAPQLPVRFYALADGKRLIIASPGIREGFIMLSKDMIEGSEDALRFASTIKGFMSYGVKLNLDEIPSIDLFIAGSVAVSPITGARLGKGKGYSDIEYGILCEVGCIREDTVVATTVHEIQLVDDIPSSEEDVPVDIVVTNRRIIRVPNRSSRPMGINWEKLDREYLSKIPYLMELYNRRKSRSL